VNVRRRLIIGFVSVATFVLILFGIVAHRAATKISIEEQLHLLLDVTEAQAVNYSLKPTTSKGPARDIHQQQSIESAIITFEQGSPSTLSNIHGNTISTFSIEDFARLFKNNNYGHQKLGHTDMLWALAKIPNTNQALFIAYHNNHNWQNYADSLGNRLFITAFMIIWLAIWAALIISKNIVQTLDKQNAAIKHQATHDELTGLPNRTLLFSTIEKIISEQKWDQDNQFALFALDINRFKEINDTIGHAAGDAILQQLTQRLKKALPEAHLISRTGGDEFAIIIKRDNIEIAVLENISNAITVQLLEPCSVSGLDITIDASMGASIFPKDADDTTNLIKSAEVAMYQAKSQNRTFLPYNIKYDPYSLKRLSLTNDLRHATKDQFILHYQPKIDISSNQTIGVEALIRWKHPTYGLVQPDEFISLAENSGLMGDITLIIIELAMAQQKIWAAQGLSLQIAINLSVYNLLNYHLPQQIQSLMESYNIEPELLKFEITESCLMSDPDRAQRTLNALNQMQIKLSIDDFGTGYSSLAYLKNLPVTELKIDRTFVKDMIHNEDDQMIVKSTIDLAHNLGCCVVAEGIENAKTFERLIEMGCDMAQGYYHSRPLPTNELEQWLATSQWPPLRSAAKA
jgi:diguanylate cyclase (GGDEF)-like protein